MSDDLFVLVVAPSFVPTVPSPPSVAPRRDGELQQLRLLPQGAQPSACSGLRLLSAGFGRLRRACAVRPQVPREFTEGTGTGPILSIVAAVVMGALFVLEFKDFMKTTTVTDLVMDPGGADGNEMYIAFKVSMPDLVRARPPQGRRLPLSTPLGRFGLALRLLRLCLRIL